jgi:hypothetical protein
MYQMSHVGPIIGQVGHFVNQAPEKIPYAIQRFVNESVRIVGVLNTGSSATRPRRRVLDRRHRDLSLGRGGMEAVPGDAAGQGRRDEEREALARRDGRAAGGAARDGDTGRRLTHRCATAREESLTHP